MFRKILRGEWLKSDSCLTTPHHWTPCSLPCPSARFKASTMCRMQMLSIENIANVATGAHAIHFSSNFTQTQMTVSARQRKRRWFYYQATFEEAKFCILTLLCPGNVWWRRGGCWCQWWCQWWWRRGGEYGRRLVQPNQQLLVPVQHQLVQLNTSDKIMILETKNANSRLVSSAIQLSIYTSFGFFCDLPLVVQTFNFWALLFQSKPLSGWIFKTGLGPKREVEGLRPRGWLTGF